jgi:ubiquitin-conjugating enzyme E2 variant
MNILLQIFFGFILADFITGFVHWTEDTYLDYNTNIPFLNKLSKDNELHHYFPRTIVGKSYLENISSTAPILIVFYLILFTFFSKSLSRYPFFYVSFFIFGLLSNIIHKWSHMRECELPKIIIFLQDIGIFCSHKIHKKHHSENNGTNYCVIFSYSNYILDNIGFWRIVENIVYYTTGVKPNRKGLFDDYKEIHTYLHENVKIDCPKAPTKDEINMLNKLLDNFMIEPKYR